MPEVERRFAAVMFIDMVGYQDALKQDESLAKHLLDKQRSVIRQCSSGHGGRYFGEELVADEEKGLKGWIKGSSVKTQTKLQSSESLVLFENALDATRCAVEIQGALREYNREAPSNKDIYVRIGIHAGDVAEKDGEVFGEVVAVASRVAPVTEVEGIYVSKQVYDQVRNKLGLRFVSLGSRELKNVHRPIEVYGVELSGDKDEAADVAEDGSRVAVLPFANISPDPKDEYFADGMTEELISTISNISELSVISRTSVMGYKGTTKKVREIGRELEVGSVLEGSVRKAGNRMRITVQLINVRNDRHLWAQSYDRDFDDVFAVQSDIAKRVADALRARILPNETAQIEKRPTKSTEAYTLYLKGRQYWNKRGNEDLLKAIEYFTQAIEIDPKYALAYSGMADCYSVLGDQQHIPYREAFPRAKEFALRATQLDDSSAEAHASLGIAISNMYDWEGAQREFKKAIQLNTIYATGHQGYGILLMRTSKLDDSLREALTAQQLDPLSPQITLFCGQVYERMGKYDLAEEQIKKVLHRPPFYSPLFSLFSEPNFLPGYLRLAWLCLRQGKYDEAESEVIEWLRLSNNHPLGRGLLAVVHAFKGNEDEARKIIEALKRERIYSYVPNQPLIIAYLRLRDKEKAVELIQREFEDHANWLPEISFDPIYSSVTSDPRVVEILKKIGSGS